MYEFDAVIVGSGPNGLAAGIYLQQRGLRVLIVEAADRIGGGLRSAELTVPGLTHDVCSAVHPLAIGSPFFAQLPLADYGLKYIQPELPVAHPLDNGTGTFLSRDFELTAASLGADVLNYKKTFGLLIRNWANIRSSVLGPLRIPSSPLELMRFGMDALLPASILADRFRTRKARALLAGMAAHSMLPLSKVASSAIALVLMISGHCYGWPIPEGGSQKIAEALAAYFRNLGGEIRTGHEVRHFNDLPTSRAFLFDTAPRQILRVFSDQLNVRDRRAYERYRYGMGVYKIDYAVSNPVPFAFEPARVAGTVHLGNTYDEIALSEQAAWRGKCSERPFVLLTQPTVFDASRSSDGKHAVWAYCHVPNGSSKAMSEAIDRQIERFAPGFRDTIIARHEMGPADFERYNPNYIGGDINGGAINFSQLFSRPNLKFSPYRTSAKGVYICSSSTPPGGGVHGMCGYHAAKRAFHDLFQ